MDEELIEETGGNDSTRNHSLVPRPWWQVGLAVLWGLIFLLRQVTSPSPSWDAVYRYLSLAAMILVSASSVVLAVMRKSASRVPVWGLIPLGLLAGFGGIWVMEFAGFYPTCALLAVTGLLFARHHGLSAGLFVLAGGMFTTSWQVEPVMYFWDSPSWRIFINAGMTALFTILTPILVLRSRSILGQAVGLLVPLAAYSAAFVFALSSVREIPVRWAVSTAVPFIALFAIIAIAGAVYTWISSSAGTHLLEIQF
jgi:hypothetical protein